MRPLARVLVVSSLVLIIRAPSFGQDPVCVSHVDVPVYPPLARHAQLEGTISATAKLNAEGQRISTVLEVIDKPIRFRNSSIDLLQNAVRAIFDKATFKPECGNNSVQLVFKFELDRSVEAGTRIPPFIFKAPNIFIIRASLPIVEY